MTPMDHAEAHERIADLALDPSQLANLNTAPDQETAALRAHVATCSRCQAELQEWREFQASL